MKYLVKCRYSGEKYFGWASQPAKDTVQGEIERILSKVCNENIIISGSGRTDKGVHALEQYFHFTTIKSMEPKVLLRALNSLSSTSVHFMSVKVAKNNFHSRLSVKRKTYHYVINMGEFNPFERKHVYQYCRKLKINKMRLAARQFLGTHDFLSFSASELPYTVRTIHTIRIKRRFNKVYFVFNGQGFLTYQIRMMVAFLIAISEGKKTQSDISELLKHPVKGRSAKKAPAEGLYLKKVDY